MNYSYEITPRAAELGGGWNLRLLEDGEEVGGGVFPVVVSELEGMAWWNNMPEAERAWHLQQFTPANATVANAYAAYLLVEAYTDAETTASEWLEGKG